MSTVAQLIAKLQTLPQDLRVIVTHPGQCCCGECFLPQDEEVEVDVSGIWVYNDSEVHL